MVQRTSAGRTPRRELCLLSAFLILVVMSAGSAAWALEQLPVARIVGIDSPQEVSPGEDFTVTVAVDYSGAYSTDIAILDAASGFVLASKGLIIPAGRNLFNFSLTGPDRPGIWMLLVAVRVWWHSGWYGNQNGGTFPFEIMVSEAGLATLNLRSNIESALVTIDGISLAISSSGLQLPLERGFHTIKVESPIIITNGTRVVFDHWSDGVHSSPRQIYLSGKLDLSAIYVTEFSLRVESSISETVGSGWYPAGTNASFAALNPTMAEHSPTGLRVGYKFSHWSGDSHSASPVGWVVMDGPKVVVASWSEDTSQTTQMYQLVIISLVFLSCSVTLIAVAIVIRRRPRTRSHYDLPRKAIVTGILLALTFLTTLAHSPATQPANALTILEPESVVIGDAAWYHWNQAASDTLLIWLGGGIVEQTRFLVNPYEFESYNTIRFIQDLAIHYDVLALKKGSTRSIDPGLNRTVFREPYPSSHNFMETIRSWAGEQCYTYLYAVGYSVGAMVAAEELVVENPEDWASPDGLIIITTKIPTGVYSRVGSLRASLLLLYGDKVAPEFITSGEGFFESAPNEGWRDGFWYHKEYHLIPDVEHEVWTIRDSGEYDKRAVLLTLKFIETSKSLQFERVKESISGTALNLTTGTEQSYPYKVSIASVESPEKAREGDAFRVVPVVRYALPSNFIVATVAFDIDNASIVSASERQLAGTGEAKFVVTLLSGGTRQTLRYVLIPLVFAEGGWSPIADGMRAVSIVVSDLFRITVIIGYPDVSVQFDGGSFRTEQSGEVTVKASPGEHLVSVPPIIPLGTTSRAVFQQWNDTTPSPSLRMITSTDMSLYAIYRRQYYLNVTSPFGKTTGTGWHDEDSTAPFLVRPSLVVEEEKTHVFVGWSGDSTDSSPASRVLIDDAKKITASWKDVEHVEQDATLLRFEVLLMTSLAILCASLIYFGMSLRSRRKNLSADLSPSSAPEAVQSRTWDYSPCGRRLVKVIRLDRFPSSLQALN